MSDEEKRKCGVRCEYFEDVERPSMLDSFDGFRCSALRKETWPGEIKKDCPFNQEPKGVKR